MSLIRSWKTGAKTDNRKQRELKSMSPVDLADFGAKPADVDELVRKSR